MESLIKIPPLNCLTFIIQGPLQLFFNHYVIYSLGISFFLVLGPEEIFNVLININSMLFVIFNKFLCNYQLAIYLLMVKSRTIEIVENFQIGI